MKRHWSLLCIPVILLWLVYLALLDAHPEDTFLVGESFVPNESRPQISLMKPPELRAPEAGIGAQEVDERHAIEDSGHRVIHIGLEGWGGLGISALSAFLLDDFAVVSGATLLPGVSAELLAPERGRLRIGILASALPASSDLRLNGCRGAPWGELIVWYEPLEMAPVGRHDITLTNFALGAIELAAMDESGSPIEAGEVILRPLDWVSAPHRRFTDADGLVRIDDLPAGNYELRGWIPETNLTLRPMSVTVEAGKVATAWLAFEQANSSVAAQVLGSSGGVLAGVRVGLRCEVFGSRFTVSDQEGGVLFDRLLSASGDLFIPAQVLLNGLRSDPVEIPSKISSAHLTWSQAETLDAGPLIVSTRVMPRLFVVMPLLTGVEAEQPLEILVGPREEVLTRTRCLRNSRIRRAAHVGETIRFCIPSGLQDVQISAWNGEDLVASSTPPPSFEGVIEMRIQ